MNIIENLYKIKFDRKDLNTIKDKLKKMYSSIKYWVPNPGTICFLSSQLTNFLVKYVALKTDKMMEVLAGRINQLSIFYPDFIEPFRIKIRRLPNGEFLVNVKFLGEQTLKSIVKEMLEFQMNLSPFYFFSILGKATENLLYKNFKIDVRNTISNVPLDLLTASTISYIFNDTYTLTKELLFNSKIPVAIEQIKNSFLTPYFFQNASIMPYLKEIASLEIAGLVVSPFIYSLYKHYSSKETKRKFKNIISIVENNVYSFVENVVKKTPYVWIREENDHEVE